MKKNKGWLDYVVEALAASAIIVAIAGWPVSSYFEARTYNKLTGAHTTTWDAMWVQLRIQERVLLPSSPATTTTLTNADITITHQ